MRVYLSVPMISNRELGRARVMAEAIEDSGHTVSSPWVLATPEVRGSVTDVFERDVGGVNSSSVIVADVSSPSIGVGMELMAAHMRGTRVVIAVKRGSVVSTMLMHMKPKETVEFDGDGDLAEGLKRVLKTG